MTNLRSPVPRALAPFESHNRVCIATLEPKTQTRPSSPDAGPVRPAACAPRAALPHAHTPTHTRHIGNATNCVG
eukprot:2766838-Prymnesium_polylepis.1